jgi:hypothetical protein
MIISHKGSSVQLHGVQPALPKYSLVEMFMVDEIKQSEDLSYLPEHIP